LAAIDDLAADEHAREAEPNAATTRGIHPTRPEVLLCEANQMPDKPAINPRRTGGK